MSESVESIHITLRCFASVREALGTEVMQVEVAAGISIEDLRKKLGKQHPELLRLPLAYAVNRDYARAECVLELDRLL